MLEFQSTLLMRGATGRGCESFCYRAFQSTLLMRGATAAASQTAAKTSISIHAPHARSDRLVFLTLAAMIQFQSTLLMRGATQ